MLCLCLVTNMIVLHYIVNKLYTGNKLKVMYPYLPCRSICYTMIQKALEFTKTCLDQQLRNQFGLNESKVELNTIVDNDGSIPLKNQNKMVLSLLHLEHESAKPYNDRYTSNGETWSNQNPSVRLNLNILMTSVFDDYDETLKFLNATVSFFQANTTLSSKYYSNLPEGIDRLEFDMEKVTYMDMHNLWSAMGAKYQPSTLYKMRMLTIQGNQQLDSSASIASTSPSIAS